MAPQQEGEMALAVELAALKRLAAPGTAMKAAREWTKYRGIVADDPTYVVTNFARKHRIDQDFFSGPRGLLESLDNIKAQFEAPRHVFIGTDTSMQAEIEARDWEFLYIEDAAEAAGWELAPASNEDHTETSKRDDWP